MTKKRKQKIRCHPELVSGSNQINKTQTFFKKNYKERILFNFLLQAFCLTSKDEVANLLPD